MSELLLNTIIDKLNMESQVMGIIRERVEALPDNGEALKGLQTQLTSIDNNIKKIAFPEKEVRQLSFDLNRATSILQQPVKNEVVHQHHIPKLLWITAGLFLMLCLVCSGWYSTHDQLQNYIASDTKYRYLKLDDNTALHKILLMTDSVYDLDPKMRDDVIRTEQENVARAELQEKAEVKQKEANTLRQKAVKRKR